MATQNKNLLVLNAGQVEKAASTDTIQVYSLVVEAGLAVTGDTKIAGDLEVTGTIISRGEENLVVKDSFIDLGLGNTSDTVKAGGFSVSMNRLSSFTTEDVTDFVAGVLSTSAPSFTTSAASALAAGDIVAITGASDVANDGLYVVAGVVGSVVTIKGIGGTAPSGSVPFVQNQFTPATGETNAKAYKVEVAAAAFADGTTSFKDSNGVAWEKGLFVTAKPQSTEGGFNGNGAYDTAAQTSLQEAYVTGSTITTSSGEGDVTIAGTEKLVVSATNGLQVSGGALDVDTSADFDLTGAFTIDGGQNVTIGATTSVSTFTVDATGAVSLDSGAASNFTTSSGALTLSGAGGVTVTSTGGTLALNGSGQTVDLDASTLDVDGGAMSFDGTAFNVGVAQDIPVVFESTTYGITASGAFTAEAGAASKINTKVGDLTLDAEAASLILDGGEAASDAVKIHASNAAGGIDIDAGTAGIAVDSTGAISLDAAALSNFTVATTADAQDLVLAVTGATNSSVLINSSGTGDDAVAINATAGGFTVDAVKAISLDSTALASNFTLTANDAADATLTIAASNSGDGVANMAISADGKIEMDATKGFSIDGGSGGVSNVSATGANLTVSTITSGVLAVTSAGNLDMDAKGTVTLDSDGGAISIGSNADAYGINIGTGAAARTITVGNDTGATSLDVNLGTGGMTVDAKGGGISLDTKGNSNFTADTGNLTFQTTTSGNLVIDSVQLLDINAGTDVEVDAQWGISLDAKKLSNFTVTGSGESLNLAAAGGGAQRLTVISAGTGADAVYVQSSAGGIDVDSAGAVTIDAAGVLSLDSGDDSNFTMTANVAGPAFKTLTLEAANSNTGGANLALKAKGVVQLGDSTAYGTALIQAQNFLAFQQAAGLDVVAGEGLAVGDAVVAKWDAGTSSVRYFKASNAAGSDLERNVHGIAQTLAGAAGAKFRMGSVTGTIMNTALAGASADVGKVVFLGTGGALVTTAPTGAGTSVFRVGYVATNTGKIMFQPQFVAKNL